MTNEYDDDHLEKTAEIPDDLDELNGDELSAMLDGLDDDAIPPGKSANIRIPKDRFDEAVNKERERANAAEQRLQDLEARLQQGKNEGSQPAQQYTPEQIRSAIETLEDKYEDLLVDGEKEEARKVRRDLNELRRYQATEDTKRYADEARREAVNSVKYESSLSGIERAYPELNPDGAGFDSEVTREVAQLVQAFVGQGVPHDAALSRAARYVLGPPAEQQRGRATASDLRQPPRVDRSGRTSAPRGVSVNSLNASQFNKLDESTLSRLRGDTV